MPTSLFARLSAVLLGLLATLGVVLVMVAVQSTRRYEQEVTQRLNQSLAAHLVAEDVLMTDGVVNPDALEHVFHTLMVINPSIEVYLLDLEGLVVTYSAPEGRVKRERVSLAPIKAFLGGTEDLPILGDDPRSPHRRKVFSVAPIMVDDRYEGYLYVVLAGEEYESVAQVFRSSQILRLSVAVVGTVLLVALFAGIGLFRVLTRRLRHLTAAVERFRNSDFSDPAAVARFRPGSSRDEIGILSRAVSQMADRIIRQVQALRQTDELRRELVANVSHDLRTPLSSLQGYLETVLLKEDRLTPDERRRFLETAGRQAERLGSLVDELFELARLESTEVTPDVEPFPLAELVQDVVQEFQLSASERGVRLAASLPDDLPPVAADIGLIQRVLQNLVENALKHTEHGGSVTVVLAPAGEAVVVRVEDTGCGIPQEDLVRVFDRFYQGAADSTEDRPRRGLGLAIVKRILDLHGSAIEAASTVGRGTIFSFSLPAVR
jgi:signal transduction histidine kinase